MEGEFCVWARQVSVILPAPSYHRLDCVDKSVFFAYIRSALLRNPAAVTPLTAAGMRMGVILRTFVQFYPPDHPCASLLPFPFMQLFAVSVHPGVSDGMKRKSPCA